MSLKLRQDAQEYYSGYNVLPWNATFRGDADITTSHQARADTTHQVNVNTSHRLDIPEPILTVVKYLLIAITFCLFSYGLGLMIDSLTKADVATGTVFSSGVTFIVLGIKDIVGWIICSIYSGIVYLLQGIGYILSYLWAGTVNILSLGWYGASQILLAIYSGIIFVLQGLRSMLSYMWDGTVNVLGLGLYGVTQILIGIYYGIIYIFNSIGSIISYSFSWMVDVLLLGASQHWHVILLELFVICSVCILLLMCWGKRRNRRNVTYSKKKK